MDLGIGRQQLEQAIHIAVAHRLEELGCQLVPALDFDVEARPVGLDVLPGPVCELAAGCLAAPDDVCDFVVAVAENVVQQEDGPFQRSKPLEQQQERHRERIRLLRMVGWVDHRLSQLARSGQQRLRQPLADVCLAPRPGRPELVDAQPGGDGGQVRLRGLRLAVLDYGPVVMQERLLHDVLGFGHAAEHPVSDREQQWPQLLISSRDVVRAASRVYRS